MLKYRLIEGTEVWIDEVNPAIPGMIETSGLGAALVKSLIGRSCNQYGHMIGSGCTIVDLHFVMAGSDLKPYQPKIVEGAELVDEIEAHHDIFPPGALS